MLHEIEVNLSLLGRLRYHKFFQHHLLNSESHFKIRDGGYCVSHPLSNVPFNWQRNGGRPESLNHYCYQFIARFLSSDNTKELVNELEVVQVVPPVALQVPLYLTKIQFLNLILKLFLQ